MTPDAQVERHTINPARSLLKLVHEFLRVGPVAVVGGRSTQGYHDFGEEMFWLSVVRSAVVLHENRDRLAVGGTRRVNWS